MVEKNMPTIGEAQNQMARGNAHMDQPCRTCTDHALETGVVDMDKLCPQCRSLIEKTNELARLAREVLPRGTQMEIEDLTLKLLTQSYQTERAS